MKTVKKTLIYTLPAALLLQTGMLKAQFTLSGEVRPRTELRDGFKKPILESSEAALFTEQRTRIKMDYKDEKMDFVISLQDVRNWGGVAQIHKSDPSLTNIHMAYAQYQASKKFGIAVGRMELNYDNARFLGNLAWAAQSRSHDLIRFEYKDSTFKAHFGLAFNQDFGTRANASAPEFAKLNSRLYTTGGNYKAMQYVWLHKDVKDYGLSLLFLNNGVENGPAADSSDVKYMQTFGFYGQKKKGTLKGTLEAYLQTGESGGADVNAYFVGATLTYAGIEGLPLTLGADVMSGTESGASEVNHFTPLYGTNHKFYGLMDYFYVGNGHGNVGLFDLFLKTKIKTSDKSALIVHLHTFSSMVDVTDPTDPNETLSRGLGQEIDLVYNLNLAKGVNFKIGYSLMATTETMEAIKGVTGADVQSTNNWAWAMFTFKPTFFKK